MQTEMTGEQELQYCIHKKRDFKAQAIKKHKGHYIMIKRSVHKEDFTFINIYAPIGAPKYIKQILTYITRESNKNTIIIDINTHSHQCTDLPYRESIWQQRSKMIQ